MGNRSVRYTVRKRDKGKKTTQQSNNRWKQVCAEQYDKHMYKTRDNTQPSSKNKHNNTQHQHNWKQSTQAANNNRWKQQSRVQEPQWSGRRWPTVGREEGGSETDGVKPEDREEAQNGSSKNSYRWLEQTVNELCEYCLQVFTMVEGGGSVGRWLGCELWGTSCWVGLNCAGVCLVPLFLFLFNVFSCVYLLIVVSICCQERLGG